MNTIPKSYRHKVEGIIHHYPPKDSVKHDTTHGAGGCICEPMVYEIRMDDDGRVVTRVMIHNRVGRKKRR